MITFDNSEMVDFFMDFITSSGSMTPNMKCVVYPKQYPNIKGQYVLIRSLGSYLPGQVFDSQEGHIEGVWDKEAVVRFDDSKFFTNI